MDLSWNHFNPSLQATDIMCISHALLQNKGHVYLELHSILVWIAIHSHRFRKCKVIWKQEIAKAIGDDQSVHMVIRACALSNMHNLQIAYQYVIANIIYPQTFFFLHFPLVACQWNVFLSKTLVRPEITQPVHMHELELRSLFYPSVSLAVCLNLHPKWEPIVTITLYTYIVTDQQQKREGVKAKTTGSYSFQ